MSFWLVLCIGIALVVARGICAYFDGYLTQAQMHAHGVTNGFSFMEHGGMWSDVFIVSPLVAYVTSKYRLEYTKWYSLLIFVIALAITIGAGIEYNKIGMTFPVADTHNGVTTAAGWIHGIFGVTALWMAAMFYLAPTTPKVSVSDLWWMCAILSLFCFLGVANFNKRWIFTDGAKIQVCVEAILLWIVTVVRVTYR